MILRTQAAMFIVDDDGTALMAPFVLTDGDSEILGRGEVLCHAPTED